MAEGKKSFLAYCDWRDTFDSLPDDKAGQLIKHLMAYVNDENPQTDDILIRAVFANIKHTLKRDLRKWEDRLGKKSEAGIISAFNKYRAKIENEKNISFINSEIERLLNKEVENGDTRYLDMCLSLLKSVKYNLTKTTPVESVEVCSTQSTVSVSVSDSVINNNMLMVELIKNQNEHSTYIESLYMRKRLKHGSLGKLLKEYNLNLGEQGVNHIKMQEYKKHFSNWLNTMERLGNLSIYQR